MIRLSDRIQEVAPSATFAIKAKAASLRAEGRSIVDLSAGEPDGTPPAEASAAGLAAIEAGENHYAPLAGLPELREAIARSYDAAGCSYSADNVLVTMGGKQALYNLFQVLFGPGDEVIAFSPYWVSYPPQIQLAGAKMVLVRTRPEDGFQPDLESVRAAITDRTRAILVNSPSNPTGCLVERERLIGLDRLAAEHDLIVISDEIYSALTYDGAVADCFASLSPESPERTVLVDAVSKTYAMTGWRVGWAVGPVPIIKACAKLQGHSTSGVCLINQRAALAAITAPGDFLTPIRAALVERRDLLAAGLDALDGISVGPIAQGAFYLFPRVDGLFGRRRPGGGVLQTAMDVADFFLTDGGVAVVPGEAFGEDRCVRVSYALSRDAVEEGLRRMATALSLLQPG
ncbi:MAG: pyridoxal phosphate-dependent aminotransferase [Myxococcota bacterium]|nr:pyridoxal phosphate-dependent aminotransferase [Myxococcota bacterium]